MTDAPLSHVFAGMLGEIEEAETKLIARQSELAREMAEVEGELAKVAAVRHAMTGTPAARRGRPRGSSSNGTGKPSAKAEQVQAWAKTHDGEFMAKDVAEALGVTAQSLGPVFSGMLRRGEVTIVREEARSHGQKPVAVYTLSA